MDWKKLQKKVEGTVTPSAAPNFAEIREKMIWNEIKPKRSPNLLVAVKNENDISETIHFARENCMRIVVHGGGHHWCGLSLREGGITIDLSQLNAFKINSTAKKAVIQPVISNRVLAGYLGKEGLAFPVGHCPTVKAGGYLLNGGMSWNMSQWGPACNNIEAIEFVLADGTQVVANAKDHSDLFWAAKGAGPGMFAVATRFHLKCFSLPKQIMQSCYYYSLEDLDDVANKVALLGWLMPAYVELSLFLIQAPPELSDKCKNHNGKVCMITAVAFADSKEEAMDALSILEKVKCKCLAKSLYETTSFDQLAEASGNTWPEGYRFLAENQCSKAKIEDIVMALREKFIEAPSTKNVVAFCLSTGQHNLLEPREDALLSMDGTSYGGIWSIWKNPKDDAVNYTWHKECTRLLMAFTSKHYIGETNFLEEPSRLRNSFTANKWKRLEQIREKYDPDGLFYGFLDATGMDLPAFEE